MTSKRATFNAIQLEVLWTRLISIVDEAAKAIVRTAFSTLSNEANDFACVLTDASGRSLAQNSGSIPSFIATLPATVRHFLDHIGPENMRPGDILVLATDGLFDNVDEEALLDLIEGSGTGASPQQLADAIAARAAGLSLPL